MVTRQNNRSGASKIVESASKFAGTLVGTAVVTGKRIIGSVASPSEGPPDKPVEKTMQAPAKRKKKAVRKTDTKVPKTKKKKVVKRKGTGSSGKSKTSAKKPAPSPAKKKKVVTPKKKNNLSQNKGEDSK